VPWTQLDIPNQSGRVAVVTGANGGLGLETARALAGAGAHVVLAARNQDKAATAEASIRAGHPGASTEVVALDLGDLSAVRTAAEEILRSHRRIDLLVNNAGLMAMPERRTVDGFELQFGVNHLGHWAFTAHLLPAILAARSARVVTVTSVARHTGPAVDPANPHLRRSHTPWRAYAQAKKANYDFGLGLQRRFVAAGVAAQSLVAHPGLSNTDLQTRTVDEGGGGGFGPFFQRLAALLGMSPRVGVRPQLRAATDPAAQGGELYAPRFVSNGAAVRRPVLSRGTDARIAALWALSERETGIALDVAAVAASL
jgi:NAD(P)-dependent dehydrogenase (short-subunit alcohol dehydrogenase family)